MKHTLKLLSLTLFVTFLLPLTTTAQSTAEEYPEIAKAVNYYLVGGTNNNFDTLKKAFHETATMKYIADGEYKEVNARILWKRDESRSSTPKSHYTDCIDRRCRQRRVCQTRNRLPHIYVYRLHASPQDRWGVENREQNFLSATRGFVDRTPFK